MRRRDLVSLGAVLVEHAQHRLAIHLVSGKRAGGGRVAARLQITLARHQRRDRGGIGPAGVGIVGQAERHQKRAEVGIAHAELAEGAGVGGNLRRRV